MTVSKNNMDKQVGLTKSTCQIRLIPTSTGKTTISFHQENLDSAAEREEMKLHWEEVVRKIHRNGHGTGGSLQ